MRDDPDPRQAASGRLGVAVIARVVDQPGLRAERNGDGIDTGAQRRVHQVGIAKRRLHLAVPQQLADHFQRGTATDQQRGEGVAQVVDVDVRQAALLLDLSPEPAHLLHRLAGHIAGE